MKLRFLILFCFVAILKLSSAHPVTINCSFFFDAFDVYTCKIKNVEVFDRVKIEKAEGKHKDTLYGNDNVLSLWIDGAPNLNSFPSNIKNVFEDIRQIVIINSNLFEITSDDLKDFPELRILDLHGNQIKVIKEDTFKFNPKLEMISLAYNKISQIDSRAFSELKNLKNLDLENNVCKFQEANDRNEVLEVVKKIEDGSCLCE